MVGGGNLRRNFLDITPLAMSAFVRWPREAVQRSGEALHTDSLSINILSNGPPSAP